MFKRWLDTLLNPSPSRSVLFLLVIGIAVGALGVAGFNFTMEATSTEEFCTSCHAMQVNPMAQLEKTTHYSNPSGVSAGCSDCHVPKEFVPKMVRKIQASREVWGQIRGIIDTPEKYAAHAPAMKAREIARLKANDSQECRNCHNADRMLMALQSSKAQQYHQVMQAKSKTCIDCHAGIAHPANSSGPATAAR